MKNLKKISINASIFIFIFCCCAFLINAQEKAGTVRKNSIGMELVYIPPGDFMMGSSESDVNKAMEIYNLYHSDWSKAELKWFKNETPQRRVVIKDGFWMGKTEVTQRQWKTVIGTNIKQQQLKARVSSDQMYGEGESYPMYYVSWGEAKEFVRRLNQKNDGFIYSLPSEAEWEFAARAGTTTNYYWGDDQNGNWGNEKGTKCEYANVRGCYMETKSEGVQTSVVAPVASFKPNKFGLYDMLGNVGEWVEDIYKEDGYNGLPTDGSPNESIGNPNERVLRGGSIAHSFHQIRSASRDYMRPYDVSPMSLRGFRIVARLKSQNNKQKKSNYLVFSSRKDGNQEVYQLDLTTGRATNLSQSGEDDGYPRCSPDGQKIAFATNRDGYWEVYLIDIIGNK